MERQDIASDSVELNCFLVMLVRQLPHLSHLPHFNLGPRYDDKLLGVKLCYLENLDVEFEENVDRGGPSFDHNIKASCKNSQKVFKRCQLKFRDGIKVTRLGTLAPPKTEGQLSICRQVNSF